MKIAARTTNSCSEVLQGAIIVISDRILAGERKNTTGPLANKLLTESGIQVSYVSLVAEEEDKISAEIQLAMKKGCKVILTIGGTGVSPQNKTPEATEKFIETQLNGLMTQILITGLAQTPQAGLSRGLVGLTSRDARASLIINAPGSAGGVKDTLKIICPLLGNIFERLR